MNINPIPCAGAQTGRSQTIQLFLATLALLALVGCATPGKPPEEIPVDQRGASMGLTPKDFVGIGSKIARELLSVPQIELAHPDHPAKLFFRTFVNNTRQTRLDVRNIMNNIEVELQSSTGGKVAIVDRSFMAELEKERERKRQGVVTGSSNPDVQEFAGIDFYLTGEITSQTVRLTSGAVDEYTLCTFRLVSARTGIAVLSRKYDIRKIAKDDPAYR